MKRFTKFKFIGALAALGLLFNCGGNDDSVFIPDTTPPASTPKLVVTETGTSDVRTLSLSANNGELEVPVLVNFKTETNAMRRLYITQNINGLGDEPYTFSNPDVDSKADGSVDLKSDTKKEFEYLIKFPAPVENATVVYTLWTTTGRGDFRDTAKRNSFITKTQLDAVVGTITIKNGTGGTSNEANVRELTGIKFSAPLADGTSKTFISIYNGQLYKISEGEETAALWDFGYYYGGTGKASLAGTNGYPTSVINVPSISGVSADQLNKCYFALSTLKAADYDAVTTDAELDGIAQSTKQVINQLEVGNVIEFVDNYGNKGLIKVTALVEGAGTSGSMTIDIKVQN